MLTKEQKKIIVKELEEKFKKSKAVIFCDYQGAKVIDLKKIRDDFFKEGNELKVAKKTLIDVALKNLGIQLNVKELKGQVVVAFSQKDEISAAKILFEFSKKNKLVKILAGILESKPISEREVENLAQLPTKEELLAKLLRTLSAPSTNLVRVLKGNVEKFILLLNAIKEKKQVSSNN